MTDLSSPNVVRFGVLNCENWRLQIAALPAKKRGVNICWRINYSAMHCSIVRKFGRLVHRWL